MCIAKVFQKNTLKKERLSGNRGAPSLACEATLKTSLELIQSIFWAPYSSVCEKPALADLQRGLWEGFN